MRVKPDPIEIKELLLEGINCRLISITTFHKNKHSCFSKSLSYNTIFEVTIALICISDRVNEMRDTGILRNIY